MKVLVCGGRDYTDAMTLGSWLGGIHKQRGITEIIHGGASGADWLAGQFARYANIQVSEYPADWKKHGRAAGPIRNKQMLDEGKPDLVVAFPGGRGTADMVRQATKAGIHVQDVVAPISPNPRPV